MLSLVALNSLRDVVMLGFFETFQRLEELLGRLLGVSGAGETILVFACVFLGTGAGGQPPTWFPPGMTR